jgi:hypothetical protein
VFKPQRAWLRAAARRSSAAGDRNRWESMLRDGKRVWVRPGTLGVTAPRGFVLSQADLLWVSRSGGVVFLGTARGNDLSVAFGDSSGERLAAAAFARQVLRMLDG